MTWIPGAVICAADVVLAVAVWRFPAVRRKVVAADLWLIAMAWLAVKAMLLPFAVLFLYLMPRRAALRLSRNCRRSLPGVSRRDRRAFRVAVLKLEADKARAGGDGRGSASA